MVVVVVVVLVLSCESRLVSVEVTVLCKSQRFQCAWKLCGYLLTI